MEAHKPLPTVTIIMPIRNEASFIARGIDSVVRQDYPAERMEILVVDGMSNDGTREVVQQIADQPRRPNGEPLPSIHLLDNPAGIVPVAMNIGLRHTHNEIVIRIDGHCEIPPDYVRRCVAALDASGAACAGGLIITVGDTVRARAIALAQSSTFGVGGVAFRTGHGQPRYVDTLAFGAYRREVFQRIGGFDEELVRNQDDELNFRLIQAGGKIWLDPSIQAVYYSRSSLRKLWRQYYEYGLYKVRVIQKRGGVAAWRHLVPALFVLSLLGSLISGALTRRPWLTLSVAGPYGLVNLGVSMWICRNEPLALPFTPLAFLALHFAYGLGFLAGLWRWRKCDRDRPESTVI